MPDEFRPEASVDFEAIAAMAEAAAAGNGNGVPHFTPPPETPQTPPTRPSLPQTPSGPLDPLQTLEKIAGDQGLMFHELADIEMKLKQLQLQTVLAFGTALLLAVLVWKFARANE
jgi:hypothetical protein